MTDDKNLQAKNTEVYCPIKYSSFTEEQFYKLQEMMNDPVQSKIIDSKIRLAEHLINQRN